eukprot:UC4_evm6s1590
MLGSGQLVFSLAETIVEQRLSLVVQNHEKFSFCEQSEVDKQKEKINLVSQHIRDSFRGNPAVVKLRVVAPYHSLAKIMGLPVLENHRESSVKNVELDNFLLEEWRFGWHGGNQKDSSMNAYGAELQCSMLRQAINSYLHFSFCNMMCAKDPKLLDIINLQIVNGDDSIASKVPAKYLNSTSSPLVRHIFSPLRLREGELSITVDFFRPSNVERNPSNIPVVKKNSSSYKQHRVQNFWGKRLALSQDIDQPNSINSREVSSTTVPLNCKGGIILGFFAGIDSNTGRPASPDPRKRKMAKNPRSGSTSLLSSNSRKNRSPPISIPGRRRGSSLCSAHSLDNNYLVDRPRSTRASKRLNFSSGHILSSEDGPENKSLLLGSVPISPTDSLVFKRRDSLSPSAKSNMSAFLGNFEESLISGAIPSATPTSVEGFVAKLGCNGGEKCVRQIMLPVSTTFLRIPGDTVPSPYIGTIDLDSGLSHQKRPGLYALPRSGTVQLMVMNPQRTGIKIFMVPFNFHDMPPMSRTFIRQRTMSYASSKMPITLNSNVDPKKVLRYAIHLRFVSSKKGNIYLHKNIRFVLASRSSDSFSDEDTTWEVPEPLYATMTKKNKRFLKSKSGKECENEA